jgi:hypothetical protein
MSDHDGVEQVITMAWRAQCVLFVTQGTSLGEAFETWPSTDPAGQLGLNRSAEVEDGLPVTRAWMKLHELGLTRPAIETLERRRRQSISR